MRQKVAAVLAVTVAAIGLAGCGVAAAAATSAGGQAAAPPSITVQGEAKVSVPDSTATFQVGVEQTASTAADALSQDNAALTDVIDALRKQGVGAKDLTTASLSVYPQYTGGGPNAAPRLTGFQASDTLQVKVTDVAKVGPLIDAAMSAGANQINSVSFGPPDDDTLTQKALAAAVDNARARAQAIATAAHLSLGPVTLVTTAVQAPPVTTLSGVAFAAQARAAVPTPVLSGDQRLTADVTVTFEAG